MNIAEQMRAQIAFNKACIFFPIFSQFSEGFGMVFVYIVVNNNM
jgi:hypothetical protein